jgi:uncharacterized membrane protein
MADSENSMMTDNKPNRMPRASIMLFTGFFIVLTGILILIAATVLQDGDSTSVGAIIFIGPIPIAVGACPQAPWTILFATILAVIAIIMLLIARRGTGKANA